MSASRTVVESHDTPTIRIDTTNRVERKKRQNRLRQKAFRERKRTLPFEQDLKTIKSTSSTSSASPSWQGYGILMVLNDNKLSSSSSQISNSATAVEAKSQRAAAILEPNQKLIEPILHYGLCTTTHHTILHRLSSLSADHRLITLVQYNVVRALIFNMSMLSLLDSVPSACGISLGIPSFEKKNISPEELPRDLRPTELQLRLGGLFMSSTASSPLSSSSPPLSSSSSSPSSSLPSLLRTDLLWINAIPFPKMRDNMISFLGTYDTDDLAYDLGRSLYEGLDDTERRGFMVWGNDGGGHGQGQYHLWDSGAWEMTEGFAKKWRFLLRGCEDDLLRVANRWRDSRGEDELRLEPEVCDIE